MRVRKFSAAIVAAAISVLGVVAVASPANATGSLSLTTTSFTTSTSTPAMTLTSTGAAFIGSASNQGIDTIQVGRAAGANAWTVINTCPTFAAATAGNAALCGIQSVVFTPTSGSAIDVTSNWKAYASTTFATNGIRVTKTGSTVGTTGAVTNTVGTTGTITVTFSASAFTTSATAGASTFNLETMYMGGANVESTTTPISVLGANQTVTFNSNYGTPTTTTQTTNTQTALTTNGFSRTGYSFGGWASSPNSTVVDYADGALYAFTSSTTLYAIWNASGGSSTPTPTSSVSASAAVTTAATSSGLASTGTDAALPLGAAATLLIVGAAIAVMRRRREV